MSRKVTFVVGMHRSGTSVITRSLNCLGLSLADTPLPPSKDNVSGYFEDSAVVALNDAVLARLRARWDSISVFPGELLLELREEEARAAEILAGYAARERHFAIKDPRLCILLPLWNRAAKRMGLEVSHLLPIRHPASVAASLLQRDGLDPYYSFYLWLAHVIGSIEHSSEGPRVVVEYDRFLDQPFEQLQRIAAAIGLEPPATTVQDELRGILDRHLNHHPTNRVAAQGGGQFPAAAISVYELLARTAREELPTDSAEFAAAWQTARAEFSGHAGEVFLMNTGARLSQGLADLAHLVLGVEHSHKQASPAEDELRLIRADLGRIQEALGVDRPATGGESLVTTLQRELLDNRLRLAKLESQLRELEQERLLLTARATADRQEAVLLRNSLSWQVTAPLRKAYDLLLTARQEWRRRLSRGSKQPAAAWSPATTEPAELWSKPAVRVVAFYLPQFHRIPENDAWWGEGFTEWTNVRAAKPQFPGHQQPREPGELGYYDLSTSEVMGRQIELARMHGIGGFCFYFYWFAGKRLLETPLLNYLEATDLDFPFCLCWANENWTRRWDGLENDVLIAQDYSDSDDLAFIEHVARYLRDPRYIRIGSRPLLLVYRPNLLPDARRTAQIWREWCRSNGIGEIYLACTQSFEIVDPAQYGYDAAVEFPPNNTGPERVRKSAVHANADFDGHLYDMNSLVARSRSYAAPQYTLFRGVCPAWDNTPRRKHNATIFLNASPAGYREWLFNAGRDTLDRIKTADERLVFVNAWNEWAEGACLEPDGRLGRAYLEATRGALIQLQHYLPRIAVVVHVYYEDLLEEIGSYLANIPVAYDLLITTLAEKRQIVQELAERHCRPRELQVAVVPNRGRDIAPFLTAHAGRYDDYDLVCKIHTKKSPHAGGINNWRGFLLERLLGSSNQIQQVLDMFAANSRLGVVYPVYSEAIKPFIDWGSNRVLVENLLSRLDIKAQLSDSVPRFPAGSMFWFRPRALRPLLHHFWKSSDFPDETGQLDGTLQHAVERAVLYVAEAEGYTSEAIDR